TGKLVRRFGKARGRVEHFALSGDGRFALLEHHARRQQKLNPDAHQIGLPRGEVIIVPEITERLWDVTTGADVARVPWRHALSWRRRYRGLWFPFSPHVGLQENGFRVRPSPGGKAFLTPAPALPPFPVQVEGEDYKVSLIEIASGKQVQRLAQPHG